VGSTSAGITRPRWPLSPRPSAPDVAVIATARERGHREIRALRIGVPVAAETGVPDEVVADSPRWSGRTR
jgi:hypothetical protein